VPIVAIPSGLKSQELVPNLGCVPESLLSPVVGLGPIATPISPKDVIEHVQEDPKVRISTSLTSQDVVQSLDSSPSSFLVPTCCIQLKEISP
jgi:hypothetical protein